MKLAMFDMDGTLFDTNEVNFQAYKEALSTEGVALDRDFYVNHCNGRHYSVFLPAMLNDNAKTIERVHNLKKSAYFRYLDKTRVNVALFDIIRAIKGEYKIALVTTASKKNTMEILEFTKTTNLFDLILTHDDITKPKPDPQGFFRAMEFFSATAQESIIFEDSDVGIVAAEKTGATVVKIQSF